MTGKYILEEYRYLPDANGKNQGYRKTNNLVYIPNITKVGKKSFRNWETEENYQPTKSLGLFEELDPQGTKQITEEWEFEGRVGGEARGRLELISAQNSVFKISQAGKDWMYTPKSSPSTKDLKGYYVITSFTCTDIQGRGQTLRYDYKLSLKRISLKPQEEGWNFKWGWLHIQPPYKVS